jgi:uncharacterized protein (DUF885 family)
MMPVGGRNGPHQEIAQMGELSTFAALDDYQAYLNRLLGVPGMLLATEEVMRAGMAQGVMPPKVTMVQVPAQIGAARRGLRDSLRKPFSSLPPTVTADERAALLAEFERVFEPIDTALVLFEVFVRDEYLPKCRDTIGASDMKDGRAWYAHQLRVHTTTDRTAADIHATGLAEVKRIRAEMMQVIAKTDWSAADPARASMDEDARFAAFIQYLRTDPRFYCKSAEELLARYREVCKRIDPKLPALFKTLPRLTYGVREIPRFMAPAQTTAYWRQKGGFPRMVAGTSSPSASAANSRSMSAEMGEPAAWAAAAALTKSIGSRLARSCDSWAGVIESPSSASASASASHTCRQVR